MTSLTGMFRGRAVWVGGTTTCVSIKYCVLWCLYGLLLMSYCESQDREESLRQLGMDSGGWKGHRRGEITNYSVHFNLWGSTQQRCNLASVFLCLWNTGQRSCSRCGITDASPALPSAVANKTKTTRVTNRGPTGLLKDTGRSSAFRNLRGETSSMFFQQHSRILAGPQRTTMTWMNENLHRVTVSFNLDVKSSAMSREDWWEQVSFAFSTFLEFNILSIDLKRCLFT